MASSVSSLTASRSPSPEPTVQPDHFYGAEGSHLPPSPDSEGRTYLSPDDDPLANRGIPVFKPTMDEFADFEAYMTRVECWGRRSGIVKVVPPKEWTDALPDIKPQLAGVKIKSPIEQFMRGRGGLFRQENMEKRKVMSVREWAELCAKDGFRAPGVAQVGVHNNPTAQVPLRSRKKKLTRASTEDVKAEPTEVAIASPPNSASPDPEDTKPDESKPRNRRVERADKDMAFLETFGPHTDWLPPDTAPADYTPEFCSKLERAFWRNCGMGKPAWYGADTMGSLFTNKTTAWNVAHLPSTLSRLLPQSHGLPGVNTPYLYFGMWRATFAWHVEDMDLFSINYIHFGAPKFWYAVPQARAGALENTMRGYFPKDTSACPQFLRHKSFLASPTLLAQSAVRPNHLVQHAGEFVITYPRGYHAGFNLGFNCAESVNFALESWLDEGRKAGICECVDFSVRIDVDQLLEDRRIDALEKTDPQAAALARAARDGVVVEEIVHAAVRPEPEAEFLPPPIPTNPRSPRKRKPTVPFEPEGAAPKRPRTVSAPSASKSSSAPAFVSAPYAASSSQLSPHKHKLTLKLGPRPTAASDGMFPCCLCVDQTTDGLTRVHDLPAAWREVCPAARIHYPASTSGAGVWMAHETCANVLPETWVDEVAGERVVFGVDGIVRGRWALKCSVCTHRRSKDHGALIQCTKGKCSKAFHINCARDGESGIAYTLVREVEKEVVLLEPAPPSAGQAEPDLRVLKVIKKSEIEALCPQHNPVLVAERRASKQDAQRADIMALQPLSRIKIRMSAGVFEVTFIRVFEERRSIEVLWNINEVREIKWSSVILGETSHFSTFNPALSYQQPAAPYVSQATATPTPPTAHGPAQSSGMSPTSVPSHTSGSTSNVFPSHPSSSTPPVHATCQPPKSEYWPYTAASASYALPNTNNSVTPNPAPTAAGTVGSGPSSNAPKVAAHHATGTPYVNQYYTGLPWSSQLYRSDAFYAQTRIASGQGSFSPIPQAQPSQTPVAAPAAISTSAASTPIAAAPRQPTGN